MATQPNSKAISHEYQVNLTVHKVSLASVAQCVMLCRTFRCLKYYTNILTNSLHCNYSGKLNSILYHVGLHILHVIFAVLHANLIP